MKELQYYWLEAFQLALPVARLSGNVFRLMSPLGDSLLVQIEVSSNLANLPVFVVVLVPNLEKCIQADHTYRTCTRPWASATGG